VARGTYRPPGAGVYDFEGPAYLRLVYHIHSMPACHMCQCNTYFLMLMSDSCGKSLYSLSTYSLSPISRPVFASISLQPITKWAQTKKQIVPRWYPQVISGASEAGGLFTHAPSELCTHCILCCPYRIDRML